VIPCIYMVFGKMGKKAKEEEARAGE
jgi:hypothetical protein